MFDLAYPWWEIVLRAILVYIVVFAIFRIIGKKQLGEMSPFDFVLLLIVSESVNGGLIGDDHSLLGGFISAGTLIGLSYAIDVVAYKSKKFEKFIEGEPKFIIKNGKVCKDVLEKSKITLSELENAVREDGVENIESVKFAILETNGKVTAFQKNGGKNKGITETRAN